MKCSVARCSTVQDTGSGSSPSRRRPGLPSGFSLRVQYLPFPRASPVLLSGLSVLSPCFSVSLFSDAQVVLIACFVFSPFFGRLPPPGSVACLQFLLLLLRRSPSRFSSPIFLSTTVDRTAARLRFAFLPACCNFVLRIYQSVVSTIAELKKKSPMSMLR